MQITPRTKQTEQVIVLKKIIDYEYKQYESMNR